MKYLLILLIFLSSCSLSNKTVRIHDRPHYVTNETVIYSVDNEPFNFSTKIKFKILDPKLSVDSAGIMVLDEFDKMFNEVIQEHNKSELFDFETRNKILDKMMRLLWEGEERYIIIRLEISDITKTHQEY